MYNAPICRFLPSTLLTRCVYLRTLARKVKKKALNVGLIGTGKHLLLENVQYIDAAQQCREMYDIIAMKLNERKSPVSSQPAFEDILAREFHRSWLTYISFLRLCDDGLMSDAKTLCRKLLEAQIAMSYLSLDPDLHSRRYLSFGLLRRYRDLKQLRNSAALDLRLLDPILRRLEIVVTELDCYPREDGKIPNRYYETWSGENVYQMARETGLSLEYEVPSKLMNYATHISRIESARFYDREEDLYGPPDDDGEMPETLFYASFRVIGIARIVALAFSLEMSESIDKVDNSVIIAASDLIIAHPTAAPGNPRPSQEGG